MSIWSDVTHDAAAAREAIEELEGAARHLEGLTDARAALARQATPDWQGALRDEVEAAAERLLEDGGRLVADLRRAAARIAEETEAAADEQRRRERRREQAATAVTPAP